MTTNTDTIFVIDPTTWKQLRNKAIAKAKRSLHLIESEERSYLDRKENWVRRYDFLVTPAELASIVENVMRDTERQTVHSIMRKKQDWAACLHDWCEVDSDIGGCRTLVRCSKCNCHGERDDKSMEVFFPAT